MHDRLQTSAIVLVASEPVLTAWSAQQHPRREVIAISDADPAGALTVIANRQARMVVLDHPFACTRQGAALIHRLRTDPLFAHVEVRLLPPERAAQLSRPAQPVSLAAVTQPVPFAHRVVSRRYARWPITAPIETYVDGAAATLLDVSTHGAQLLSSAALRPGQRVRIVFARSVLVDAKVAWGTIEHLYSAGADYLAGVEFLDADDHQLHALFSGTGLPGATNTGG